MIYQLTCRWFLEGTLFLSWRWRIRLQLQRRRGILKRNEISCYGWVSIYHSSRNNRKWCLKEMLDQGKRKKWTGWAQITGQFDPEVPPVQLLISYRSETKVSRDMRLSNSRWRDRDALVGDAASTDFVIDFWTRRLRTYTAILDHAHKRPSNLKLFIALSDSPPPLAPLLLKLAEKWAQETPNARRVAVLDVVSCTPRRVSTRVTACCVAARQRAGRSPKKFAGEVCTPTPTPTVPPRRAAPLRGWRGSCVKSEAVANQ